VNGCGSRKLCLSDKEFNVCAVRLFKLESFTVGVMFMQELCFFSQDTVFESTVFDTPSNHDTSVYIGE
jgi:hypothetical protein